MNGDYSHTAIVTGASGFVGAHLVLGLRRLGWNVVAVGGKSPLAPAVEEAAELCFQGDLNDTGFRRDLCARQSQLFVHAAACANAGRCEDDPRAAEQINVAATEALVEDLRVLPVDKRPLFVFLSTDLVFDGCSEAPSGGFKEADTPRPLSVYGRTKFEAENLVTAAALPSVVLRSSLVYGQAVGGREGFMAWLRGGLAAEKEVTLFTDEWRTPVFVGDIVAVVNELGRSFHAGDWGQNELYNLGGPERLTRYQFGLQMAEVFNYDASLLLPALRDESPANVARPPDVSLCVAKIQRDLKLSLCGVKQGLAKVFNAE